METDYLLRSPGNAERLLEAKAELEAGGGVVMDVDQLREHVGLPRE